MLLEPSLWPLLLAVTVVLSSAIPLTPDHDDLPQDRAEGLVDDDLVAPVVGDVFSTYYLHLEEKGRNVMEELREEEMGRQSKAEIGDLASDPLFRQFLQSRNLSLEHHHLQHPETGNKSSDPFFLHPLETGPLFLQSRNLSLDTISLKLKDAGELSSDPLYLQYGVVPEQLGQTLQVAEVLPLKVLHALLNLPRRCKLICRCWYTLPTAATSCSSPSWSMWRALPGRPGGDTSTTDITSDITFAITIDTKKDHLTKNSLSA